MRHLALALGLVSIGLVACGPTLARTTQPLPMRPAPAPEPQLLTLDKGFTFPLAKGSRIPIANGWIEPRVSLRQRSADVDIVVAGAGGSPSPDADVTIGYDMLEMAHGVTTVKAEPATGGHHLAVMRMGMHGTWRIAVTVVLDGVASTVVLLLLEAGL